MRVSLVVIALLALTVATRAQPAGERPPPLNLYIWPEIVKALEPGAPAQARSASGGPGQSLATAGREDMVVYDFPAILARKVCKPLLQGGRPLEPVAYIAEGARNARVTIINEAHAEPLTRYFIERVAEALRPLGYGAYAAETFNPGIGEKSPAMPLLSDGYYSAEPIYGRLIRRLRALDFRLLPYEANLSAIDSNLSVSERMSQRAVMQAANLLGQVNRQTSKVLVHAGQGNNSEYAIPDRPKVMGGNFAETSGIHPLTIDTVSWESPDEIPVVCDPAASSLAAGGRRQFCRDTSIPASS